MLAIISIAPMRGIYHEAMGQKFLITLSDKTTRTEWWEFIHDCYNIERDHEGMFVRFKVPFNLWDVQSVVGQEYRIGKT